MPLVADPIFRAPKGTHDILWPESARRRALTAVFADIVEGAGYTEVVPPMFEHVEVFHRLGDATDVADLTQLRDEMHLALPITMIAAKALPAPATTPST